MKVPFKPTPFHSRNFLPLFVLISVSLQFVLVLLVLFQGVQLTRLENKPPPSLVQMVNGKVLKTAAADPEYRSPTVLTRMVKQWATMTFNWSGRLPSGESDPGVEIDDDLKIPTSAWAASFMLSEDFRVGFLKTLAEYTSEGIFKHNKKTVLQFQPPLLEPEQIEAGKWKVSFVANLLVFKEGQPLGTPTPINKTVYLRVAPQPEFALENGASEIQNAVYAMRETGLQIYQVEEFKR
jgi:hypothetical protein